MRRLCRQLARCRVPRSHGTVRGWLVAVGALAAFAVLVGTPATADPTDDEARRDKQRVDEQLAQAAATYEAATRRARDAATAYTAATTQLPGAQQRLALARGRLAAATVAANRARRQAEAARRVLATATATYQESQRRVAATKSRVGEFVAAANRGQSIVAYSSIFTARSLSDFVDRLAYLDQSAAALRRSLRRVSIARQDARVKQNAATAAQRAADATRADAERLLTAARDAEQEAGTATSVVSGLVAKQAQALAVAQAEEAESERRYRELPAESARIATQLRQFAARNHAQGPPATSRSAPRGGAPFVMPADGWKSSDFGMRLHPIAHRWRLHSGMDIAAPGGSPIRAAAGGVVVRASWNGGYGKYTCIYHGRYQGDALATCYAHQSRILVSRGQRIRQGQLIGRIGTTGSSTGYHLHFEVRRDGDPVNPRPYLPPCLC